MNVRDLIKELIKEDMDSEIRATYQDDDGETYIFSLDGIQIERIKSRGKLATVKILTIVLNDF